MLMVAYESLLWVNMFIKKRKIRVLDKEVILIKRLQKATRKAWKLKRFPGKFNEEGD